MENGSDNDRELLAEEPLRGLREFLAKAEKPILARQWIETDVMRIYVRKSMRILEGQTLQCLDIAAIEVQEEYQGQGLFKTFVTKAHQLNPYQATCIEHAQSPYIEKWCQTNGWRIIPNTFPPSFYLPK